MDNKSQTRHEIEESSVERDFGVMINSKLKFFVTEATLFAAKPIISKRLSVVSIWEIVSCVWEPITASIGWVVSVCAGESGASYKYK